MDPPPPPLPAVLLALVLAGLPLLALLAFVVVPEPPEPRLLVLDVAPVVELLTVWPLPPPPLVGPPEVAWVVSSGVLPQAIAMNVVPTHETPRYKRERRMKPPSIDRRR
jgi:hypothetical protein